MIENESRKERAIKWFATLRRVLKESFTRNLHTKILALVIAFAVWPVMMIYTDPMRTRTVENVVVRIDSLDFFSNEMNLAIVENISDMVRTVDVDVSINQSARSKLSANSVTAYIDMMLITETGKQRVPIMARSDEGTVVKISPEYIEVTVETRKNKLVPVVVRGASDLPEHYREIEAPRPSPSSINISGAESVVSEIQSALVLLDYSTLGNDNYQYSLYYEAVFVDSASVPVTANNLTVTNGRGVSVYGRVLPTAEKPIVFDYSQFDGSPLDGYELRMETSSIYDQITELEKKTVTIAAPRNVLNSIDSLTFEPIDITGKKESFRSYSTLRVPGDVEWQEFEEVSVFVVIYETPGTRAFDNIDLEVSGLKAGMQAEFDDSIKIRAELEGGNVQLQELDHEDIAAYLDLSDYNTAGTYEVPVAISIRQDTTNCRAVGVNVSSVTVTIRPEEGT